MKAAASLLFGLIVFQDPCAHAPRGAVRPIRLDDVARVHREAKALLDLTEAAPIRWTAAEPFDTGLPACRSRNVRRMTVPDLPEGWPALYVSSATDPAPEGAIHVATSAPSLREIPQAAGGAALFERLGIRCRPTLVRPFGSKEVELVEGN